MQLSERLKTVAGLIKEGTCLADVGTDHGYIPIYLVSGGVCQSAIAMDIGKGPLERAKAHIKRYGLEEKIATRLSDGVRRLEPGEADCMVVAGMGGALTIHILEDGKDVVKAMKECVLQPQSEISKVRQYLWDNGYAIVDEEMVLEDGKFYPMMRVIPGQKQTVDQDRYDVYSHYGQVLLEKKHPVLKAFLKKEYETENRLVEQLSQQLPNTRERLDELEQLRHITRQAMEIMGCL